MDTMGKTTAVLATAVAILMSGSAAFASNSSKQVRSKRVVQPPVWVCTEGHYRNWCHFAPAGTTLPPCRGGHKGPNGVVIQCF